MTGPSIEVLQAIGYSSEVMEDSSAKFNETCP